MNTLLALLHTLFAGQRGRRPNTARALMERAEARAGRNPAEARELRRAAGAYLRVVR